LPQIETSSDFSRQAKIPVGPGAPHRGVSRVRQPGVCTTGSRVWNRRREAERIREDLMAMRAETAQLGTRFGADDDLLTRYMRALLRTGGHRLTHEDVRTCASCGSHSRFDRCTDNDSWSRCSACGALA